MDLARIVALAAFLGEAPKYIGFISGDSQLNICWKDSQGFDNPDDAFKAAQGFAAKTPYTRLDYGVRAEIGDDVVVSEITGYIART